MPPAEDPEGPSTPRPVSRHFDFDLLELDDEEATPGAQEEKERPPDGETEALGHGEPEVSRHFDFELLVPDEEATPGVQAE
eukprot:CAMPEP_0168482246 /NCGR_PEP_ID=MMETSP0228-20121227/64934_1 /TAXON_ID=133427 /ORGANISM="Protoceratium reticulatum, Strain CCCM 535 (=CCMP 1889)" /LENGTH=80 /DNA_ID=CAMNT_0008498651 /DNA_START=1 /DNA_END=240 /DNA_ORIENTATION=-